MAVITSAGLIAVVAFAFALQFFPFRHFSNLMQLGLGIGKTIQPVSDFPYQCRRIHHPQLQSCEDMWLSESTGQLYLACSNTQAHIQWFPPAGNFKLAGRFHQDAIIALDINQAGLSGDSKTPIRVHQIKTLGYTGTAGDGLLTLCGFTGIQQADGKLQFLTVNVRPSLDPVTGAYIEDQARSGANSTVELFETTGKASKEPSMKHVGTFADQIIATPNRVAALGSEGFYFTNDHGFVKAGDFSRFLAMFGKGNVAFCSYTDGCQVVSSNHAYPNGLMMHSDGKLYVPSSGGDGIQVFQPQKNHSLEKVADMKIFYSIDNLSEDSNGDIWAAIHPKGLKMLSASRNPFGPTPPTAVMRIRKSADSESGYTWEKIIEDRDGEVLPGTTTVVHVASTGRLFLSGPFSDFITVCDPKV